jgi:hypothetical protein
LAVASSARSVSASRSASAVARWRVWAAIIPAITGIARRAFSLSEYFKSEMFWRHAIDLGYWLRHPDDKD